MEISNELRKLVDPNNECCCEHSLANKCKEWACSKGFILISYKKPYEAVKKKGYCQTHHIHDKTREKDKPFVCDFEYEAIIKACEWILSEVNK